MLLSKCIYLILLLISTFWVSYMLLQTKMQINTMGSNTLMSLGKNISIFKKTQHRGKSISQEFKFKNLAAAAYCVSQCFF